MKSRIAISSLFVVMLPGIAGVFAAETPTPAGLKTYHVGNSLTDTVVNTLAPMAISAGRDHVLRRCTIPGAPTDYIWKVDGHKGFGESDFTKTFKQHAPFDCIITQPFAGHSRSIENETEHTGKFFELCRESSPDVQLWIYQQWPSLTLGDRWSQGTISLGKSGLEQWKSLRLEPKETLSDSKGWQGIILQRPPAKTWEQAVANHSRYFDILRAQLRSIYPDQSVRVIPAGQALTALRKRIEAGEVPGINDFKALFSDNLHMGRKGKFLVTAVFYACLYQDNPTGKVSHEGFELTDEQARIFEEVAWKTVTAH